ncbi:hypothetical protein WN51_06765 [Melipona quadrifasciata]|uniref:Uncharacterized protein n=1 Tax=Melipona quadrifasciata TaxID=166423 RepID=A0A0M8ZT00_9HYME|nr:hypothetical protein WN51_06765 [Melipona quadrifasciata]
MARMSECSPLRSALAHIKTELLRRECIVSGHVVRDTGWFKRFTEAKLRKCGAYKRPFARNASAKVVLDAPWNWLRVRINSSSAGYSSVTLDSETSL